MKRFLSEDASFTITVANGKKNSAGVIDCRLEYGTPEDLDCWMQLVRKIRANFPGLETEKDLAGHAETVRKFMLKRQAVCVKDGDEIAGVLLFSQSHNMICCLGVSPAYRRRGVATLLMDEALRNLDRTREISVCTFREDDPKGPAPRALYRKYGFLEDALVEEQNYPNQLFVLHPAGAERYGIRAQLLGPFCLREAG